MILSRGKSQVGLLVGVLPPPPLHPPKPLIEVEDISRIRDDRKKRLSFLQLSNFLKNPA
jgi:hypothetical protein